MDINYDRQDERFHNELREKVQSYFNTTGLSRYANGGMWLNTLLIFLLTLGCYGLILSGQFSDSVMLILCIGMGIGFAGFGAGIAHDASHKAYSKHRWVNRLLAQTLNLMGANEYNWHIKHNILHHRYPNIYEKDEDVKISPLMRVSPSASLISANQYQHLFAIPAYATVSLSWLCYDIIQFFEFTKVHGRGLNHPKQRRELVYLVAWKLFYLFYILYIPYVVLAIPFWKVSVGFLVMHVVLSMIIVLVFQVAHLIQETQHGIPDSEGRINDSWAVHQVKTTANFSCDNRLLTWYIGGLNYQIEHHLFCGICSVHYPAIRVIVKQACAKYDIPYYEHKTFGAALKSHFRYLRQMGNSRQVLQKVNV